MGKSYDLYEKVGFEKGMRPNEQDQQYQQYQQPPMSAPQYNQGNAPQVNVVPDYYYHQPVYPQYGAPAPLDPSPLDLKEGDLLHLP